MAARESILKVCIHWSSDIISLTSSYIFSFLYMEKGITVSPVSNIFFLLFPDGADEALRVSGCEWVWPRCWDEELGENGRICFSQVLSSFLSFDFFQVPELAANLSLRAVAFVFVYFLFCVCLWSWYFYVSGLISFGFFPPLHVNWLKNGVDFRSSIRSCRNCCVSGNSNVCFFLFFSFLSSLYQILMYLLSTQYMYRKKYYRL